MIYGSICSGIEAATCAWHPLGWQASFYSEIDKFPRAVLAHHYPEVPLHGDFTTIKKGQYQSIDLLIGGTPCQSFSVAGLRGGLGDDRGNLALEFLRLADRLSPRWLVWENVPGVFSSTSHVAPDPCEPPDNVDVFDGCEWVGEDEYDTDESHALSCFLAGLSELGYGYAYRTLDAQHFGVPQRRQRIFVVGYLGDWRRAAAVLFERESMRGHNPPSRQARQDVAPTISARTKGGGGLGTDFDLDGGLVQYAIQERAVSDNLDAGPQGKGFQADIAYTLEARNKVQAVAFALRGREDGALPEIHEDGDTCSAQRAAPGGSTRDFLAFDGNNQSGPIDVATACNAHAGPHGRLDFESETFIAHALRADGFDASEDGTGRGTPLVPIAFDCKASGQNGFGVGEIASTMRAMGHSGSHQNAGGHQAVMTQHAVRRLTPRECERLQGFPDDYTAIPYRNGMAADGPRYKALGNSMAVPVMRWIGERIQMVDQL